MSDFGGSQNGPLFDHPGSVPEITVFGAWAQIDRFCPLNWSRGGPKGGQKVVKKGSQRGSGTPQTPKMAFFEKVKKSGFLDPPQNPLFEILYGCKR